MLLLLFQHQNNQDIIKPLTYFIPFILFIASCNDKHTYFTGQVEYQYSYESTSPDRDSLAKVKPWKSIFRYDMENYQSLFIGKDTFAYYYNGRLNKCLSGTNSLKVYECEDYGLPTDSVSNFRIYETDEKIMGYRCKVIEFQARRFLNKYYVSKDLFISPGTYNKHLAYNWQFTHDKTGGGLSLNLNTGSKTTP